MAATVLFSFDTPEQRRAFCELLTTYKTPAITAALASARLDPTVIENAELYVGGELLFKGSETEVKKRYQFELAAHRGSVEVRVERAGKWITTNRRQLVG